MTRTFQLSTIWIHLVGIYSWYLSGISNNIGFAKDHRTCWWEVSHVGTHPWLKSPSEGIGPSSHTKAQHHQQQGESSQPSSSLRHLDSMVKPRVIKSQADIGDEMSMHPEVQDEPSAVQVCYSSTAEGHIWGLIWRTQCYAFLKW